MAKIKLLSAFLFIIFMCGCAGQVPQEVNVYKPANLQDGVIEIKKPQVTYAQWETDRYKVLSALFEYKGIYVADVEITNKTSVNVQPGEYSIALTDGNDRLHFMMISAETIQKIRDGIKGETGGKLDLKEAEQRVLDAAVSIFQSMQPSDVELLQKGLNRVIDQYFAFRPIWAGDTRKGLIAFKPDFRLEYPIRLSLAIKGDKTEIIFVPSKGGLALD